MKNIGKWASETTFNIEEQYIFLELGGIVVLDMKTDLPLPEVAARIGQALGIVFGEDEEGIYEEIYALTSVVLDQHFAVYQEPEDSVRPYAGRIVLEVMPHTDPMWLGMKEYKYLYVNIAEHLAALLRKKTGLPFVAHKPITCSQAEKLRKS